MCSYHSLTKRYNIHFSYISEYCISPDYSKTTVMEDIFKTSSVSLMLAADLKIDM